MRSHYDTLGISDQESADGIKCSYRKLVKLYHPDRFPIGSKVQAEAEERMREINAAYSVLSKPFSRARYDARLRKRGEAEPEHCRRCGNLTGYWHGTPSRSAVCHTCVGVMV